MSKKPKDFSEIRANTGKWLLGSMATLSAIVAFITMLRSNWKLALVVFLALLLFNALWFLLYILFHKSPAAARGKVKYQYAQYRGWAVAGILVIAVIITAVFSVKTVRESIVPIFVGTATPTNAPELPQVTMLVTAAEEYSCGFTGINSDADVQKKSNLDIAINNNSDRDMLITAVTLHPDWITASQWMGPIPISETYDVLVDTWWDQSRLAEDVAYGFATPAANEIDRIKKEGDIVWFMPDPITVEKIAQDKFVVKAHAQDRFIINLGLTDKFKFLYGKVAVEITTDSGITLKSDLLDFSVCYQQGMRSMGELTQIAGTQSAQATAFSENQSAEIRYAWNDLSTVESGGVELKVARLVLASSPDALDIPPVPIPENAQTFGEIIFHVKNNGSVPVMFFPCQFHGDVPISGKFGQHIDGTLDPGFEGMGGCWFSISDQTVEETTSFSMFIGCPFNSDSGCAGPDLRVRLDLSSRANQPIPPGYAEQLFANP